MDFENKMPEWKNEGTEPSTELKTNGFKGGYKPPAAVFNYMWALICKAITEIQNSLSKVNNTADSEKSVKFASEAGVGRKVKYPLTLRFNGGETEGTDLWNYDGGVSKSINITPDKIKARPTHKPNIVVNAVREVTDDGKELYVATDSTITELYNGLEITIIPNERNTTSSPRLKINDFEDKGIRLPLSFNCAATTTVKENYFQTDRPITFKYHSALNLGIQGTGAWIFADRQKTSAQDLYGSVPIENGGTGAGTAEAARENLGVAPAIEDTEHAGCYYRMVNGEKEWINPPLLDYVEYKTTRRIDGKPVYVTYSNVGTFADVTGENSAVVAEYRHGESVRIINCSGGFCHDSYFYPISTATNLDFIERFEILHFDECVTIYVKNSEQITDIGIVVEYIKN